VDMPDLLICPPFVSDVKVEPPGYGSHDPRRPEWRNGIRSGLKILRRRDQL
jgi:hypothetical protein